MRLLFVSFFSGCVCVCVCQSSRIDIEYAPKSILQDDERKCMRRPGKSNFRHNSWNVMKSPMDKTALHNETNMADGFCGKGRTAKGIGKNLKRSKYKSFVTIERLWLNIDLQMYIYIKMYMYILYIMYACYLCIYMKRLSISA